MVVINGLVTQLERVDPLLLVVGGIAFAGLLAVFFVIVVTVLGDRLRRSVDQLGPRAAGAVRVAVGKVGVAARGTWWAAAAAAAHFVPSDATPAQVPGAVIVAVATNVLYALAFVISLAGETPINAVRMTTITGGHSMLDLPIGDLSAIALSAISVLYGLLLFDLAGWSPGIGPWNRAGPTGRRVLAALACAGLTGVFGVVLLLSVYTQMRLALRIDLPILSVAYAGLFQVCLMLGLVLSGFSLVWLTGLAAVAIVALVALTIGLTMVLGSLLATMFYVLGSVVEQLVGLITRLAEHVYHTVLLQSTLAAVFPLRPIVAARPRALDARS